MTESTVNNRLLRQSTFEERKAGNAWELWGYAFNIESALVKNGAIPGKDYTILDLFKLAVDFMKSESLDCLSRNTGDIADAINDFKD